MNRKKREYTPDIPMLKSMKVSDLIAIRESRHRKRTREVNHALMRQLDIFYGKTLYINDINEEFCLEFSGFLLKRISESSARTYLHKLHAILESAVTIHLISRNPMPPIRTLLPGFIVKQRSFLTQNELLALANTPCRHFETKRAFMFACQTGLRISDIETLRWTDIVEINGTPTVVKTQIKTHHEVRIPLNPIALQLLQKKNDNDLVFNMMSRSVISSDLRQWALDAGLDKTLSFHVSRHTFATLSISAGVNIYVVSKLCGHTSVKTTEIYAHMIDKTLQNGVYQLYNTMIDYGLKNKKTRKPIILQSVKWVVGHLFKRKKTIKYRLT